MGSAHIAITGMGGSAKLVIINVLLTLNGMWRKVNVFLLMVASKTNFIMAFTVDAGKVTSGLKGSAKLVPMEHFSTV